jgi:hypothetical protein
MHSGPRITVLLSDEDKQVITERMTLCCNGMSESEMGRRAIFQYLEIKMTLRDKSPGSFYVVHK